MPARPPSHTQEDYRGYSLRTFSAGGTTMIYFRGELVDTVSLKNKGMCRTTLDKAKDLVDEWQDAK